MHKNHNFDLDQVLEVKSITTPYYLLELGVPKEDIILVHRRGDIKKTELNSDQSISNLSLNNTLSNLTGPLEVDLSVNSDIFLESHLAEVHFPTNLNVARKFINGYINKDKPIYCVCDGQDKKRIVIIGSNCVNRVAIRTLVSLGEIVEEAYIERHFDELKREHIKSVGLPNPKVDVSIKNLHELYGSTMGDTANTESVAIEASWTALKYQIPDHGASIKMILKTMVGSESSIMYSYFEDLKFLHNCIDVMSMFDTFESEEASIDGNYFNINDILSVDELMQQNMIINPHSLPNSLFEAAENITYSNFTDNLWKILKYAKTVENLKEKFEELFEVINRSPARSQIFSDDDKSTVIGKMISDVYSGTQMRPYLASKQCLALLIDLGIQKLKRDYIYLLKFCDFRIGENVQKLWNDQVGSFTADAKRTTFLQLNANKSTLQINYLSHLHVILEFLQLVEQNCSFLTNSKVTVLKQLYNSYIVNKKNDFTWLFVETKHLYEFVVPLSYSDINCMNKDALVKWQLTMSTNQKNYSVVTKFNFSKKPIFPAAVINDDEANQSLSYDYEKFHTTKLQIFSDKIP